MQVVTSRVIVQVSHENDHENSNDFNEVKAYVPDLGKEEVSLQPKEYLKDQASELPQVTVEEEPHLDSVKEEEKEDNCPTDLPESVDLEEPDFLNVAFDSSAFKRMTSDQIVNFHTCQPEQDTNANSTSPVKPYETTM